MNKKQLSRSYPIARLNAIWFVFVAIFAVVVVRLFYLQIIKHEEFLSQANASQIKSLEIEAERGTIYASNGDRRVPLVINERRWTLFADSLFIADLSVFSDRLAREGIALDDQQRQALERGSRYVVLRKSLNDDERRHLIDKVDIQGFYFQKQSIRRYLEDDLAAQVLGFLNADSRGQYGIEQFYHEQLTGLPGRLKTTTDVHDVPLLFVEDNVLVEPQPGKDIVLTLDVPLQRIVETQLETGVADVGAASGSAIILDAETGAILAMANYPGFNPADYQSADIAHYANPAVENIVEPASVLKVLVMAAALNEGAVELGDTYYNPRYQTIDGRTINNWNYREEGTLGIEEILSRSLNTGSVEILKRLADDGTPDSIDLADRQLLADYYTNRFRLSQRTGVDLPNEVSGNFHPPDYRWIPSHLYATMTFGQSITVTPLQLAAAYAAIFNGGRYYQPYVAESVGDQKHSPELLSQRILEPAAVDSLRELMRIVTERRYGWLDLEELEISGKTGTAQVVDFENGGYIDGAENGLMIGYIKGDDQTLIVLVVIKDPQVAPAGYWAAQPVWAKIIQNIIALGRISR